ncbi:cell division protein ZipA C-terminal FtsZ-binding domain-containing protein [Paraflavitalea speifideaquila]|uniref:cell division protein ZipA C-terminal FtsZ-binding domain-containing protein n=1 Tax=Paraflavitalea speifideaquila TaxID=3076558 RepID=UPI0028E6FCA7|nr:cell division protein ZipA C-terminal FtsZ-binding domain-containing protein [Paraflavitalea speifideiaquila]
MIYLIIVIALVVLGILSRFVFKPKPKSQFEGIYISTQGQSNERIKALGLSQPSENVAGILEEAKLDIPTDGFEDERIEYKADPDRDWIIDLVLVDGGQFKQQDLLNMFDFQWRDQFDSTIFGISAVDNRWTYAFAGNAPKEFTKIQLAINFQDVYSKDQGTYDPDKLTRYTVELEKRIKKYPGKLRYKEQESVDSALSKAIGLVQLHHEFNRDIIIVLQSDQAFNGMQAWDVLQNVGLVWGDGDLFHWNNYESNYGNDQHFSVWTTTNPGYFFPEEVKAGNMNPHDLVFGFSIPRSADPKNVFEIMFHAVKYCQHYLGGPY